MKYFSMFFGFLIVAFLSLSVKAQWVLQHAPGLPNSSQPQIIFSPVDDNVCWGKNSNNSQFVRTTDGGDNWTVSTVTGVAGLKCSGISAINADTAWIAMNDPSNVTSGGIFNTIDGGTTWNKQNSAFPVPGGHPNVIHFFDADNGLCVGNPRGGYWEIYTTTDGGTNWIRVPSANIPAPLTNESGIETSYDPPAGNFFWFPTLSNRLYRTTDQGYTWTVADSVTGGPSQIGFGFAFRDNQNGLAADFYPISVISKTTDGGETWAPIPYPPGLSTISSLFISYVKGTDSSYVITSQTDLGGNPMMPGTAYSTDNGYTWIQISNIPLGLAAFSDWNTGWAGGLNDEIWKWNSSILQTTPWFPQHASGLSNSLNPQLSFSDVDDNISWGVSYDNSQFVRTTNSGQNWTVSTITGATGLHGASISAIDANIAYAAMFDQSSVTSGGVFKTTDGGSVWNKQITAFPGSGGDPADIHFFDDNNGVVIGNPHNGNWEIYTTTNGGAQWNQIINIPTPIGNESTGGGLYASSGDNIWFGSYESSFAIYRSTDKGYNWQRFPQAEMVTFCLAFKDALNGLAVNCFVNGNQISRTTDGGVTWDTIPNVFNNHSTYYISYVAGSPGAYEITSQSNLGLPFQTIPGSSYSTDNGSTWNLVDYLPHGRASFSSALIGWSGGVNDIIYKWDSDILVSVEQENNSIIPDGFILQQNYPNPFNPSTKIRYSIPTSEFVTLKIYDVLGSEVVTLVNEEKPAGSYEVEFNSHSGSVRNLTSGVYFYTLQAGSFTQTKKLILMK